MAIASTRLEFLDDMDSLTGKAVVLAAELTEDGKSAVVLDKTWFYPQGGGQPFDMGKITAAADGAAFEVTDVRNRGGVVHHLGHFAFRQFSPGEAVSLQVDHERRLINSRLHTAGHVLDAAYRDAGHALVPTKAFHFPAGAYVEYAGEIPAEMRETVRVQVEKRANEIVATNPAVAVKYFPKAEAKSKFVGVPDFIPDGQPVRVVFVTPDYGCPCGGTHVARLSQLGKIAVPKVACKSGSVRVSYSVSPS